MKITILGRPVSKKNSKRNFRHKYTGRIISLPSEAYERFRALAIPQVKQHMFSQTFKPFANAMKIDYVFYRKGKLKQDFDNAIASINDILQDAGMIEDDVLIVAGTFKCISGCEDWKTEVTITSISS